MNGTWTRIALGNQVVWASVNYRGCIVLADEPFSADGHRRELVVAGPESVVVR